MNDKKVNEHDNETMREELRKREVESGISEEANSRVLKSENSSLGRIDISGAETKVNLGEEGFKEYTEVKTKGIELSLKSLPSKGKFYPGGTRIHIKSAKTSDIKDFSLMDEENPLDINDKLNNILSSCVTVSLGFKVGSYKDILEDDKMFIILSIREMTFPKGESKLTMKSMCNNCDHENHFELRTENLQFFNENEKISKYYSLEDHCYVVDTKTLGAIILSPPKIGVMQEITSYAKSKEQKREKWDKSAIQILPYLNLDWRGLKEDFIFNKLVVMNGWDEKKFSSTLRLIEWMKSGIKPTLEFECEKCYNEVKVDVKIESGMKSLFIRSEQDLEDELL